MPRLLSCLVLAALLTACGSSGSAPAPTVPGLAAPAGQGLVGEPTGELTLVEPVHAPVGTAVPVVGTCLSEVPRDASSDIDQQVGQAGDCAEDHAGVVVGVEGFDPAELQQGSSRYTSYERLESPADVGTVLGFAAEGCQAQVDAVTDHATSLGEGYSRAWSLRPTVRLPTMLQWQSGERWAACLLVAPELQPIEGGVDLFALSADQPLPRTVLECRTTVGSAVDCGTGAAAQTFALVPIPVELAPAAAALLDSSGRDQVADTCRSVLAVLDPGLAAADWVDVRAGQAQFRDVFQLPGGPGNDPSTTEAECSIVNRNFGAGLVDVLT